jgi:phage major head subunit gpT-like protein
MSKPKKQVFSATKAVKANARERLGTPPTSFALPTTKEKAAAKPKHKETLADLLADKDA